MWANLLRIGSEFVARVHPAGRYGQFSVTMIGGTPAAWAELRWAARAEAVCHLDDLLLRRVRLGLLLPGGGAELLPRVRTICQPELGWSDRRWEAEAEAYLELWHRCYRVPVERAEVIIT